MRMYVYAFIIILVKIHLFNVGYNRNSEGRLIQANCSSYLRHLSTYYTVARESRPVFNFVFELPVNFSRFIMSGRVFHSISTLHFSEFSPYLTKFSPYLLSVEHL